MLEKLFGVYAGIMWGRTQGSQGGHMAEIRTQGGQNGGHKADTWRTKCGDAAKAESRRTWRTSTVDTARAYRGQPFLF